MTRTRQAAVRVMAIIAACAVVAATGAGASTRPGRTTRVSQSMRGEVANDRSERPVVSADGRYVAFATYASNLGPADTTWGCPSAPPAKTGWVCADVYVREIATGKVTMVSVASDGTQGNAHSREPSISADGRFVTFISSASNLVPRDRNLVPDIFVHDRDADGDGVFDEPGAISTELVSVATDGTQSRDVSAFGSISPDGRYVVFSSVSNRLVPGDTNNRMDVFLRDRVAGTTERVSVADDGSQAAGDSQSWGLPSAVSAGGRYVAFYSAAANLVAGDTNRSLDAFVRDREAGRTVRVSLTSTGAQMSTGAALSASLSPNGRYVAFLSNAASLVPGDTDAYYDVFVHDRDADADGVFDEPGAVTTERVSIASDGTGPDGHANHSFHPNSGLVPSSAPALSADGRYVAFHSVATKLVGGDTNGAVDAFVHDRVLGITERVTIASDGAEANTGGDDVYLSADGRHAAFVSAATNLAPIDLFEGDYDLVVMRDRGPATGVGGIAAVAGDMHASISGWATFDGAAIAATTDAADDGLPGARLAGVELTGARVLYRPESRDLLVRLDVAELPVAPSTCNVRQVCQNMTVGGSPGAVYALEFAVAGKRYRVHASAPLNRAPAFALDECTAVACTSVATLRGGYGTAGNDVRVAVPLGLVGVAAGSVLTDVRAFTAVATPTGAGNQWDEIVLADAVVPGRTLAVGLAPAGTREDAVMFSDRSASLSDDGSFSAELDVTSLPAGDYDVWAKACLGSTCAPASTPLAITPQP